MSNSICSSWEDWQTIKAAGYSVEYQRTLESKNSALACCLVIRSKRSCSISTKIPKMFVQNFLRAANALFLWTVFMKVFKYRQELRLKMLAWASKNTTLEGAEHKEGRDLFSTYIPHRCKLFRCLFLQQGASCISIAYSSHATILGCVLNTFWQVFS